MVDRGEWWRGISNKIKEKGGISLRELDKEKQQVINQHELAEKAEEWAEASRLAKNVVIYNELIKLNRNIMEDDVIRVANSMSPTLDAKFDPLVEANDEEGINLAIKEYIPIKDMASLKSRKRKSRKRNSRKKRKSRKRKSRKRKSRGRKSKRRNR